MLTKLRSNKLFLGIFTLCWLDDVAAARQSARRSRGFSWNVVGMEADVQQAKTERREIKPPFSKNGTSAVLVATIKRYWELASSSLQWASPLSMFSPIPPQDQGEVPDRRGNHAWYSFMLFGSHEMLEFCFTWVSNNLVKSISVRKWSQHVFYCP